MTPEKILLEEKSIVGLVTRTNNHTEMQTNEGKIGPLWHQFLSSQLQEKLSTLQKPVLTYGVYNNFDSDIHGDYDITLGHAVLKDGINSDFHEVKIFAGSYLHFKKQGEMPQAVIEAWQEVWSYFKSNPIPRAYKSDFECYSTPDTIDIYISLK